MSMISWMALLTLALAANLLADGFIRLDRSHGTVAFVPAKRRDIRVLRWCVCTGGLVALAVWGLSLHTLFVMTLFSVSAAIDFKTHLIPPDTYVFGCVLLNLLLVGVVDGLPPFRDAVVAQAFCFAIVTLGVAFFNLCESGDIKLAMQFGAACGSLPMVALSAAGIWLVALGLVLATFVFSLRRLPVRHALRIAMSLRPPQGPLMWCGLLIAHAVVAFWRAGVLT